VLADSSGNTLHLLDRDCSVQRRYQKLIEEAPAPALAPRIRAALCERAVLLARAVNYTSAGTVEFLIADGQFYFMEMNTRLQVEHPVTEAVTGLDLVEWQIRIARGESLPFSQDEIRADGHAIEARLLAEDPSQGFVPQAGAVRRLRLPENVRVDTGIGQGGAVSIHYDSLVAKIIAHGTDRAEALARLEAALAETAVTGIATNRAFLMSVVSHPEFAAGGVDTDFIAGHREELLTQPKADTTALSLAVLAALRLAEKAEQARSSGDRRSPWSDTTGWRLFGRAATSVRLVADAPVTVTVTYAIGGYDLLIAGERVSVSGTVADEGTITAAVRTGTGERTVRAFVDATDDRLTLFVDGAEYTFRIDDPRKFAAGAAAGDRTRLTSPMPGQVVSVAATAGQTVGKGEPLVVVEAMKMEHTIAAPRAGRVSAVNVRVGDRVAAGIELIAMEEET
jgi:3-methylcrotonyl-CoA carboxylase alpha subunit